MNCSLVGRPATLKSRIPSERFTPADFCCGCGLGVVLTAWAFPLACTLAAARILRMADLRVTPAVRCMRLISASCSGVQLIFFICFSCFSPVYQVANNSANHSSEGERGKQQKLARVKPRYFGWSY